jgi:hypothetical protein
MCHPCYASASLEASLGNPNLTRFQAKQADRSRCVSCAVLLPSVSWCNRQTVAHLVWRPKPRNRRGDFVGQITKPQLPLLRPKPGNPSTLVLRLNQETRATRLLVHGTDHTQRHPTSRSSSHHVPDMCFTIPSPLHYVSYSYLDPHCSPPWLTCHLDTMRQANMILHTNI